MVLKTIPIFKTLADKKLIQIIENLKTVKYKQNGVVCNENQPGDTFYIIKSGTVNIYR